MAPGEHTVREAATPIATERTWYIWNNLHLFPLMFLLHTHNIYLAMQESVLGVPITQTYVWQHMKLKKPDLSQT
jgi:hypothetical protein